MDKLKDKIFDAVNEEVYQIFGAKPGVIEKLRITNAVMEVLGEPQEVFADTPPVSSVLRTWELVMDEDHTTHKGFIVAIQPIKKPEPKTHKVRFFHTDDGTDHIQMMTEKDYESLRRGPVPENMSWVLLEDGKECDHVRQSDGENVRIDCKAWGFKHCSECGADLSKA